MSCGATAPQFSGSAKFGCSLTLAGYGYPFTQVRGPHLPLEVDGQPDCDVWWNEVARGGDGRLVATGQTEHQAGNLVLSVGRQSAHRRKSLLKELGHPR